MRAGAPTARARPPSQRSGPRSSAIVWSFVGQTLMEGGWMEPVADRLGTGQRVDNRLDTAALAETQEWQDTMAAQRLWRDVVFAH